MRTTIDSLLGWFRTLPTSRRTLLILVALCTGGLVLSWISRPTIRTTPPASLFGLHALPPASQPDADLKAQWERIKQSRKTASSAPMAVGGVAIGPVTDEPGYATPM